MSRRAKKNAARAVLGAVLLAMALFALLPFVYMGLVSLTQKTVLDLRFDPAEFSFKNYARVFSNFNIGPGVTINIVGSRPLALLSQGDWAGLAKPSPRVTAKIVASCQRGRASSGCCARMMALTNRGALRKRPAMKSPPMRTT